MTDEKILSEAIKIHENYPPTIITDDFILEEAEALLRVIGFEPTDTKDLLIKVLLVVIGLRSIFAKLGLEMESIKEK